MARLTADEVVALWVKYSPNIPAAFALGSATHESDLDPSVVSRGDQSDGSDSIGLYQISKAEAIAALRPLADLLDAEDNTAVFASIMETKLAAIRAYCDVNGIQTGEPDLWAYLAMSHNMGIGSVRKTLATYGMDWPGYKLRNPGLAFVAKGYGDDAITGGRHAGEVTPTVNEEGQAVDLQTATGEGDTGLLPRVLLVIAVAWLLGIGGAKLWA